LNTSSQNPFHRNQDIAVLIDKYGISFLLEVANRLGKKNYSASFLAAFCAEEDRFAFTPGVSRFGFTASSGTAHTRPKRSQPDILPSSIY